MLAEYCIPGMIEAGCDEAGRGPLAGSVFAAAVVFGPVKPEQQEDWAFLCAELNDSKQLTESMRNRLRPVIERTALSWAVAEVTAQEIDQINILNAAILGMHRALGQLQVVPQHIIVDGNKWKPYVPDGGLLEIPARTVVKGDGKYLSIAAASVLAKTYRDEYMVRLDAEFPQYGWKENKGYPTAEHYKALQQFGPCRYHRKSFRLA